MVAQLAGEWEVLQSVLISDDVNSWSLWALMEYHEEFERKSVSTHGEP